MEGRHQDRRERWLKRANAAFDRMFGDKHQEELLTMTQREDMAVLIMKELAAFLLEEHIAGESAAKPQAEATACPKCGQPGKRFMKAKEAAPERTVTTRAGEVRLELERFRCVKCRIPFFSARQSAAPGDGRLQSEALQKAVRQASKASFAEASDDLRELAEVEISATHLQRLSERIGLEVRDEEVAAFEKDELGCEYKEGPRVAGVMLDGGRAQMRAEDSGQGVVDPHWQEVKVACCLSLISQASGSIRNRSPRRNTWSRRRRRVWRWRSKAAASLRWSVHVGEESQETSEETSHRQAGAHRGGDDGGQRDLRLASRRGGATSRFGSSEAESLRLRRPTV